MSPLLLPTLIIVGALVVAAVLNATARRDRATSPMSFSSTSQQVLARQRRLASSLPAPQPKMHLVPLPVGPGAAGNRVARQLLTLDDAA